MVRRKKKRRGEQRLRGTPTKATVWASSESGPEQARNRKHAGEGTIVRDYYQVGYRYYSYAFKRSLWIEKRYLWIKYDSGICFDEAVRAWEMSGVR